MEIQQPFKLVYKLKHTYDDKNREKEIKLVNLQPYGAVLEGPKEAHSICTYAPIILELELENQQGRYQPQCSGSKWGFSLREKLIEAQNICRCLVPELTILHRGTKSSTHNEPILLEAPCSKTHFTVDWGFPPGEHSRVLELIVTYDSNPIATCCNHHLTATIPLEITTRAQWMKKNCP
jgi:hypothetical protein